MYEKKHALPNKKIHTPKGIARLTVTAATQGFFKYKQYGIVV